MELFTNYQRTEARRYATIFLEQERIGHRKHTRYKVEPKQDGLQVLVDAYSPEYARSIYEREFHVEATSVTEV
jgi:hypothetical protein